MSKFKNRLKIKNDLNKQLNEEKNSDSSRDMRLLNFYDLNEEKGEKMQVLIFPDAKGRAWHKYRYHSAPKGVRGVKTVGCVGKSECPICQKGFDYYNDAKEATDKREEDALKKKGRNLLSNDAMLTSVIVLDSPCDINESEDGNQVKLFKVPIKAEKKIEEAIVEGFVDSESICTTPFIIKKTKNDGGFADYSNSYFARQELDDDVLDALEDLNLVEYDYDDIDTIPDVLSDEEAVAWYENLEAKVEEANATKGEKPNRKSVSDRLNRGGSSDEGEDDGVPRVSSRLRRNRKDEVDVEVEEAEQEPPFEADEPAEQEEEVKKPARSSGSSLRARLRNAESNR